MATVCNYFENNASRMRYDEYLAADYPIATGVIEGACRHVIKDRMEQGGMRWTLAGAEAMLKLRGVAGVRVLQGLLHLARKNPGETLAKACSIAHGHAEYRLRTLRALLKRQEAKQPLFEFMDEHPLIRPLADYGRFVRDALRGGDFQ